MGKLCETGVFFRDFLKSRIPNNSFLTNGIGSLEVSPANYGQLNEECLQYNRIITVPLVNSGESREAGLVETYNCIFSDLSRTGRVFRSNLSARNYDLDILRIDLDLKDLPELLLRESELFREEGLKIRDRVRLTFDVNYVHSLPEWVLKKPRLRELPKTK
ncbi:MAG: hypothetical protein AABW82_00155 [Nanoarchaeota archaeon]